MDWTKTNTGGTRGDEYEGPALLLQLLHSFDPARLQGGSHSSSAISLCIRINSGSVSFGRRPKPHSVAMPKLSI